MDTSGYESGLSEAGNTTSSFADKLKIGLATAAKVGTAAIGAATTAVVAFAKSSVETGMNFDSAVSQLAATMGTTVDQIQDLRDKAMELGAATSFSATEAAEGLNILAMAGLSAEEQIAGVGTVLDLAAAGAISMESAASYAVGAVKGFGDSIDNVQYYADLMAKGATLANTSVDGLGEAMSQSAATASSYGQTAEGVTMALLRLAEQNVTGSEAATAMNRAMADLYAPTDAAKTALKELGVSAYDSSGNARDLNDVMDDLSAALSTMSAEEATAYASTIFTTQGLSAFNKMTAASADTIARFSDGLDNAMGSAAEQAATQLDNLAGDITIFGSALEGAQIVLSDQLTPTLREFVQFGTNAISTLSTAFQDGGLSGAMDALGTILSEGLSMVIAELPGMIDAGMQLLGALGKGLLDNLPTITSAAVEILVTLVNGVASGLPQLAEAIPEIIGCITSGLAELFPAVLDAGMQLLGQLTSGIETGLPDMVSRIPQIVDQFLNFITENLPAVLDQGVEILNSLVNGILVAVPDLVAALPELITSFVGFITDNLPAIVQAGMNLLLNLSTGIIGAIPDLVAALPQIIAAITDGLIPLLDSIVEVGGNIVSGLLNGIVSAISGIGSWLMEHLVNPIVDGVKSLFGIHSPSTVFAEIGGFLIEGLLNGITGVWDSITGFFSGALDGLTGLIGGAWDTISGAASSAWEGIKSVVGSAWEGIKSAVGGAVDTVSGSVSSAWESIKSTVSTVGGSIGSNVSDAWNNVKSSISTNLTNAKTAAGAAWSAIKSTAATVGDAVKTNASTAFSGVKTVMSDNLTAAKAVAGSVFSGIKSLASGDLDGVRAAASTAMSAVKNVISSNLTTAKDTASSIFNSLKSSATTWGKDICSNLASGLRGAISTVTSAASSVASRIRSFLHFSEPDEGPLSDFHTYMPDMLALMAQGIRDNAGTALDAVSDLTGDMAEAMRLEPFGVDVAPEMDASAASTAARIAAGGLEVGYVSGGAERSAYAGFSDRLDAQFEHLFQVLGEYFPQFANTQLWLDGKTLVGGTARDMDKALGQLSMRKARTT